MKRRPKSPEHSVSGLIVRRMDAHFFSRCFVAAAREEVCSTEAIGRVDCSVVLPPVANLSHCRLSSTAFPTSGYLDACSFILYLEAKAPRHEMFQVRHKIDRGSVGSHSAPYLSVILQSPLLRLVDCLFSL
jgi:hypothetical protein